VRGLARTDLEAVTTEAARLVRVDRKYLLPRREAQSLIDHLAGTVRVLELEGLSSFRYASLYYDTAPAGEGALYRAAATGRRRRAKVRTRCYLDSEVAMLEVKLPTGRDENAKHRLPLDWAAAQGTHAPTGAGTDPTALPEDPEVLPFLAAQLESSRTGLEPESLHGVLRTSYRRTTLVLPAEQSRLTLDQDLTWSSPSGARSASTPMVVVETKSGPAPSSADHRLWRRGHRPVRISKFSTGLAVLGLSEHAAAPSRWHRTLGALSTTAPR
jgi:hypothetical protein